MPSNSSTFIPDSVIVHPVVLLSVIDHFKRVAQNTSKQRVVGVLLGTKYGNSIRASNSFAIPFEEDEKDAKVWFLDHNYLENMFTLFRKVNAKERIVGWYHSGPNLRPSDLAINDIFKKYTSSPVLVIVPSHEHQTNDGSTAAITTTGDNNSAYFAVEEASEDGSKTTKTFAHLASTIDAEEAEEIGVEHLLRDVKDISIGDLNGKLKEKIASLNEMGELLDKIQGYLVKVSKGDYPINHQIVYNLQKMFNLMPDVVSNKRVLASLTTFNNDAMLMNFIAALSRSVISLHSLISNKLSLKHQQQQQQQQQ